MRYQLVQYPVRQAIWKNLSTLERILAIPKRKTNLHSNAHNSSFTAQDLNDGEDRKVAAAPFQYAEDFEVPVEVPIQVSTPEVEERKVKSYSCQTRTRKRNRRDEEDKDKHLVDEDENVQLEQCKMLQLPTPKNTRRRSKRLKQVKGTMEVEQNELSHVLDEDKYLPCQEDKIQHVKPRQKSSSLFDTRFKELAHFKREYGHCRVPHTKSKDAKYFSLGNWVAGMRRSYISIQRGETPKLNLSQAGIKRLGDIGFEWKGTRIFKTFEDHFTDLLEFKEEYRHCRAPQTKSKDAKYYSLGHWGSNMRRSYKAIQRGEKPKWYLSQAEIKRLEDTGFEWESTRIVKTFEDHFTVLLEFKEEYGHCRAPQTKSKDVKYFSLGNADHTRQSKEVKSRNGIFLKPK